MTRYFYFKIKSDMRIVYEDDLGNIRYFEMYGDPSNFMEKNVQWIFNVRETFPKERKWA